MWLAYVPVLLHPNRFISLVIFENISDQNFVRRFKIAPAMYAVTEDLLLINQSVRAVLSRDFTKWLRHWTEIHIY